MTRIRPELWVDRAAEAVAFYQAAFGAIVLHRVGEGEDIVAQLAIGNAAFWVARAGPAGRRVHREAVGGATGRTLLVVDDPMRSSARRSPQAPPPLPSQPTNTAGALPGARPVRPSLGNRSSPGRLAATQTETATGTWQREYGQPPTCDQTAQLGAQHRFRPPAGARILRAHIRGAVGAIAPGPVSLGASLLTAANSSFARNSR